MLKKFVFWLKLNLISFCNWRKKIEIAWIWFYIVMYFILRKKNWLGSDRMIFHTKHLSISAPILTKILFTSDSRNFRHVVSPILRYLLVVLRLGLWCLTPLSTIFQLYPGDCYSSEAKHQFAFNKYKRNENLFNPYVVIVLLVKSY